MNKNKHRPPAPVASLMPATRPNPMVRLGRLIRRHPLIAFFALANALSWTAWLPYVLSLNGLGVLPFRVPEILGTSQFAGALPGAYLGPITAAFLVTAIVDGRNGLRAWAGRLWRWRVAPRWYAITLLAAPAGMVLTGIAFSGGQIAAPSLAAISAYAPMLLLQLVTTGLAEEPGWRDFALPRLQSWFSPLSASFILGPLWALWHAPLFLTEWGGYPDAAWWRPLAFAGFCIAFNIVMSWVFNRSGQSLPLSMLMHVSVNTFASVLWFEMFPAFDEDGFFAALFVGAAVAAVAIVIGTRGTLGCTMAPSSSTAGTGIASAERAEEHGTTRVSP